MTAKEKTMGAILIVLGMLPLILKIKGLFPSSTEEILSYIIMGEILYQGILILMGIFLVFNMTRYRYISIKEKISGIILILIAIIPFIVKNKWLASSSAESVLSYFIVGEIAYQALIILLGIMLVFGYRRRYR
jgi:branched-subunit amino acid transport protein